eukprot:666707-Rhodomonas_salina.1
MVVLGLVVVADLVCASAVLAVWPAGFSASGSGCWRAVGVRSAETRHQYSQSKASGILRSVSVSRYDSWGPSVQE